MQTALHPRHLNSLSPEDLMLNDMRSEDLSDIVRIEQTTHISPWARLSFEESLTRGDLCRIVRTQDEIIAYHVASEVIDELHILNVVCAPKAQGHGLGHLLMQDIIDHAEANKLKKLFLEVRASNVIAQSLYRKWGFKQIAVRKKYYRPTKDGLEREDALVFLRELV